MTVRGAELLARAEVVVYDALVNLDLLRLAPPEAELIYAGKRSSAHAIPQDQLNQLLVDKARAGKCVVRLKGGDPYVFGRGGEEAEQLAAAGVPFEVVPGVSSSHCRAELCRHSADASGLLLQLSPSSPATKTRPRRSLKWIGRKWPRRPAPKSSSWGSRRCGRSPNN